MAPPYHAGALLAYLTTKLPDQVPILLTCSAITIAAASACLFWLLFSLLRKLPPDGKIVFRFPDDKRYFVAVGLVYGLVMLSLIYLMLGLWKIPPMLKSPATAETLSSEKILTRPSDASHILL